MNLHGGEENDPGGGRVFEAAMTVVFAIAAAACIEVAVNRIETHAPEAISSAAPLGMMALFFTGVSIHQWHNFRKPPRG